MLRREDAVIEHAGIDEKSFRRGYVNASIINDLNNNGVWYLVKGRKTDNAMELLDTLTGKQRFGVRAVAIDIWVAFEKAVNLMLPNADIVHDKFHISAYLNKAVDDVRKAEHRALMKEGDETMKNSKFDWLRNFSDLCYEPTFQRLYNANLEASKAWRFKESLSGFLDYIYKGSAVKFFKDWCKQVNSFNLEPVQKVSTMLDNRLQGLLNYLKHRITNAASEGMNSLVARIIANARGCGRSRPFAPGSCSSLANSIFPSLGGKPPDSTDSPNPYMSCASSKQTIVKASTSAKNTWACG